ncbi:MAG: efflux transporter outer membrane subunit [Acidovorax sp.]|uniref:efflux transporter outer membrane subunit n=2 Tax=unclassified Acidovorax TaxID=2684926 RepID=UPI00262B8E58|nr:efflux transporter outer membrane subunit [Acidovorax sp.]MDH4419180.1 efflux transporter outer membrane subunit [Acidovorax sp.]
MISPPTFSRRTAWPVVLVSGLWLAGCAQTPPYERPRMDIPTVYKEQAAAQAQGIWKPAQPQAVHTLPATWWKVYGDSVLDRLQQQADANSPTLAQSAARLRAAQAAVASSSAAALPTVGASASSSRARSGTQLADGGSTARISTSHSLGLSANWELDLWGRISAGVSAAQASAQASADDLAAARLSLQAAVAQTYFSLRTAEAQATLLAETLKAYHKSWELTRNRHAAGVASSADVAQAEVQYKSTQVQLLESETTRSQLQHALAALLGQAPAAFALEATAVLPAPADVPQALPSDLLQHRPDIAGAERRVAAANAQIGVARAAYFPALTLSAAGGYRGSPLADLFSAPNLFWSLGPALAASIFDGGARSAAVETARANHAQVTAAYRQTVLTALQEVEDNLTAAAALAQEEQLQREATAAAQRALDVVENQYRAGTVGYLNVLNAQATVLSSQRSLIDVKSRRLSAVNALLKNVAGRWEALPPA